MSTALSEQEILRRESLTATARSGINPYPAEAFTRYCIRTGYTG